jgi:rhodanese-related sulfurtransferase
VIGKFEPAPPPQHGVMTPAPRSISLIASTSSGALRLFAAALLALAASASWAADSPSVNLDTARAEHEAGRAILIDIREPREHARGVAPGARLLPLSQIRQRIGEIPTDPSQPVLLICNTQNRSGALMRSLRESGLEHVRFVHGGMSEWARRGWPMQVPVAAR